MSSNDKSADPLEFLKGMWGGMGLNLPGMVTPTLDTDELDRRIADLKTVEGWLKMNLNMLSMSIQGLEMQRAALGAVKAMSESGMASDAQANNPFTNPALWPWNLMPGQTGAPSAQAAATPTDATAGATKAKASDKKAG